MSVQHAPPNDRALDNAVRVFASAEILWKFQQLGCCAVFFGASGRAAAIIDEVSGACGARAVLLFASCVLVARMTYAACGSAACLLTDGSGITAYDSRSAGCVRKRSEVRLGQISETQTQINLFFRRRTVES